MVLHDDRHQRLHRIHLFSARLPWAWSRTPAGQAAGPGRRRHPPADRQYRRLPAARCPERGPAAGLSMDASFGSRPGGEFDVAIVGGGFYGCCMALFMRSLYDKVVIVERGSEL